MKPARGPQTMFFGNYCNEIPGLATYEMPSEVCEGNFFGTSCCWGYLGLPLQTGIPGSLDI